MNQNNTFLKADRTEDAQNVIAFTGDGAYHGSTKAKEYPIPDFEEPEMTPTTILDYRHFPRPFELFRAKFPNKCDIEDILGMPSQEQIRDDGTTFVWCPIDTAIQEAGPLTKSVLLEMRKHLKHTKKFIYIDSKIQYFKKGDLPVDSKLWHVDGTIAIRDNRVKEIGYNLLHDMKARMLTAPGPTYLAYQSSFHCATEFADEQVSFMLPDCIENFDILDNLVQHRKPATIAQPAGSIISFDGKSLHRAVPATEDGWRLWVRCAETDREVKLNSSIINCYGTVYRKQ